MATLKHPAFVFAAVVALATTVVLVINAGFEHKIKQQRADYQRRQTTAMLAGIAHDNNVSAAWQMLSVKVPTADVVAATFARHNNVAVALVVRANAKNGYGGPITFLLMTKPQTEALPRLRVLKHLETPGIADFLNEADISRVYDGVSGATISATALALAAMDIKEWAENCVRWENGEFIC